METRELGPSTTTSRLCLGTMTFGDQVDERDASRIVDAARAAGVNFFDTANVYAGARSEEILGRCLGAGRSKVVLASKVRGRMETPEPYEGLSSGAMRRGLEDSLRRLGTDYLDLYYLHMPDYETPIDETLETLERFREEGKIRQSAVSNYSAWQHCDIFRRCERRGWAAPSVAQPMYNVLTRDIEQEYVPFAKEYDVKLVVYNPLAGGLLTGKQSAGKPLPGTRFDGNERYLARYWKEQYFEAVERLKAVSSRHGRSLLEIAFRWLLDQDHVTSVILGVSRLEHLEANLAAAHTDPLSKELREDCDAVWQGLRGPVPQYNR